MAVAHESGALGLPADEWIEPARSGGPARQGGAGLKLWLTGLVAVAAIVAISPAVALGLYQYEHVGRVYPGVSVLGVDLHWRCAHELAALTLGVVAARARRTGDLDLALRVVGARMALPVDHGELAEAQARMN